MIPEILSGGSVGTQLFSSVTEPRNPRLGDQAPGFWVKQLIALIFNLCHI